MKLGTPVHHVQGYQPCLSFFKLVPWDLAMVFQVVEKNRSKIITKL